MTQAAATSAAFDPTNGFSFLLATCVNLARSP